MPLYGKTDSLVSIPKHLKVGQIFAINVTNGGSGYTNGTQACSITGGGGTGAAANATVVGGIITAITVTATGYGYTTAPSVTVATGAGLTTSVKLHITKSYNNQIGQIIFVDDTEANAASNKTKGLTSPGWWRYYEWLDSLGNPRSRAELLYVITSVTNASGGDRFSIDTGTAPQATNVVTISGQPTNQTTVSGGATFSITATLTSGSQTYQWERAPAATPTVFAAVGGATSASLVLSGRTGANTGDLYRCVVGGAGAKRVVSNTATLTFGT
jgi:hypothetical protein